MISVARFRIGVHGSHVDVNVNEIPPLSRQPLATRSNQIVIAGTRTHREPELFIHLVYYHMFDVGGDSDRSITVYSSSHSGDSIKTCPTHLVLSFHRWHAAFVQAFPLRNSRFYASRYLGLGARRLTTSSTYFMLQTDL